MVRMMNDELMMNNFDVIFFCFANTGRWHEGKSRQIVFYLEKITKKYVFVFCIRLYVYVHVQYRVHTIEALNI